MSFSEHLDSEHLDSENLDSSECLGVRCSSTVRAFAHGAMGHRIDPSWGGERDVAPW